MHPLKRYRKIAGISQKAVAKALGLSVASVSRIENWTQGVSPELAKKIEAWSRGRVSRLEILWPEEYLEDSSARNRKRKTYAIGI